MKHTEAFREAKRVCFGRIGDTAKFLGVELCMTVASLSPCLLLLRKETAPWALIAVPLFILVMFWARVNAALAMQDALAGGKLATVQLADPADYGKKLLHGLIRLAYILIWSIPLIACILIARAHVAGTMDGFTLMRLIRDFGGGDLIRGAVYLLLIGLACLLLTAFGCAFHSGDRHAAALGDRKLVKGKHLRIVGVWLESLVALLPGIIAVIVVVFRYLPVLRNLDGLLTGQISMPDTRATLIILVIGLLLTLPFLPLRSLWQAAYVRGLRKAEEQPGAEA